MTPDESKRPRPTRKILRRVGAVVGGMVVIVILDTGLDIILHATGIYPPWFQPMRTSLWLLAIGYRSIDSILGCYITATIAPDRPIAHALVLGIVGVVLSSIGTIATWSKGPEFGPKWYPITLVIIALPCALIGGILRQRQVARRA
jgi:hypothetical protein